MNNQISFEPFDSKQLKPLHEAFLKAFSSYFTAFQPSIDQFEHRVFNKLNVSNAFSELAWMDQKVVGFILHAQNEYQGKRTLYNGGTGVIPSFQRQHIAHHLYENILRRVADERQIDRLVLEVIDKNERALRFYESLGFLFLKEVKCFKLKKKKLRAEAQVLVKESITYQSEAYLKLLLYSPSFMDSWPQLETSLSHEVVLEASADEVLVGFIIFNPNLGRISQIGANNLNVDVMVSLLAGAQSACKNDLTIMNIPVDDVEVRLALESIGFVNELTQYEMELSL